MAPALLSRPEFEERLRGEVADVAAVDALFTHYRELMRWSAKLSLVGPGDIDHLVERHYLDCLRAAAWIPSEARVALDVGSGGGFPGLVLAAAVPAVCFHLVEARQKKWVFLRRAAAAARLEVRCLHESIVPALPESIPREIDLITIRALRLPMPSWESLISRLTPGGRVVVWAGAATPALPASLRLLDEQRDPSSRRRRILLLGRVADRADVAEDRADVAEDRADVAEDRADEASA